jgi:hypothetical protein
VSLTRTWLTKVLKEAFLAILANSHASPVRMLAFITEPASSIGVCIVGEVRLGTEPSDAAFFAGR